MFAIKADSKLNRTNIAIDFAFTGPTPDVVNTDFPEVNSQLVPFQLATTAEVRKIIMSSPSKCCDLDPLAVLKRIF